MRRTVRPARGGVCRSGETRQTYRAGMDSPTHDTDDSPAQDDLVLLLLEAAIVVTFIGIVGLAALWVLPAVG